MKKKLLKPLYLQGLGVIPEGTPLEILKVTSRTVHRDTLRIKSRLRQIVFLQRKEETWQKEKHWLNSTKHS